jgi:hypothetical protein
MVVVFWIVELHFWSCGFLLDPPLVVTCGVVVCRSQWLSIGLALLC